MEHKTESIIKVGKQYYIVKYCFESKYRSTTNTYEAKVSCVDFYPLKKCEYIHYFDKIVQNYITRIKYKIKKVRYGHI